MRRELIIFSFPGTQPQKNLQLTSHPAASCRLGWNTARASPEPDR